eukprot:4292282-Pyramimonas_sp.AAC.1
MARAAQGQGRDAPPAAARAARVRGRACPSTSSERGIVASMLALCWPVVRGGQSFEAESVAESSLRYASRSGDEMAYYEQLGR